MGLTFTEVPIIAPGTKMKASQLAALALAPNERILSGLGSGAPRVGFLCHSVVRSLIAGEDGDFQPDDAYWVEHLMREAADDPWLFAAPGDPGGPASATHINAWVNGAEALDLLPERQRLATVPTSIEGVDELTPKYQYELAIAQAGVFDPASGDFVSPAFEVAQAYSRIRSGITSPHGNTWGGISAGPEDGAFGYDPCTHIDGDPYFPNLDIFFTRLSDGFQQHFDGTCPDQPTHIAGIGYGAFVYFVVLNNGTVYVLPKRLWIEGPYTGDAAPHKQSTDMLSRGLTEYGADFRGTAEQRGDDQRNSKHQFRLREFGLRQYALAPRLGQTVGEEIVIIRPKWAASGGAPIASGTALPSALGGTTFTWPAGTVCHSIMAHADGLAGPATLRLLDGSTVVASLTLTPDESGHAEGLIMLAEAHTFAAAGSVKAGTAITFAGDTKQITFEASAVMPYLPQLHDFIFCVRLARWNGSITAVDGEGIDCTQSREISTGLLTKGCLEAITAPEELLGDFQPDPTNGVYQALRRLIRDTYRIVREAQLVDYAVEGGKSILWFKRDGGDDPTNDLFAGVGPARDPIASGSIVWGRTYVVSVASVIYHAVTYGVGEEFIGLQGVKEFTGEGAVREKEGIRAVAEPQNFTNRWVLDLARYPYHTSETSQWYQPVYADLITPFYDPCILADPAAGETKALKLHFAYGVDGEVLVPEAMPEARYWPGIGGIPVNDYTCGDGDSDEEVACRARRQGFYRSCQVVVKPLEIESATRELIGSTECVKLVLSGRLQHHHALAPASIDRDRTTWDVSTVATEAASYRTDENAIREWLLHRDGGSNCDYTGPGNEAAFGGLEFDPDNPFGACLPRFRILSLARSPYLDANDSLEGHDSATIAAELRRSDMYLRALCEGNLAGTETLARACGDGTSPNVFQYTYPGVMFDANMNRWPRLFPEALRPDNPESHGPMPGLRRYAEDFNQLARCWNKLRDYPVFLPLQLQWRLGTATGSDVIGGLKNARGAAPPPTSFGEGGFALYVQNGPGPVGEYSFSGSPSFDWQDAGPGDSVAMTASWYMLATAVPDSEEIIATRYTQRQTLQYRWVGKGDSPLALPPEVAALLESSPGMVAEITTSNTALALTIVDGETNGTQSHTSGTDPDSVWSLGDGTAASFDEVESGVSDACQIIRSGGVDGGSAPGGYAWHSADADPGVHTTHNGGNLRTVGVVLGTGATPIVSVPLVPYPGGS